MFLNVIPSVRNAYLSRLMTLFSLRSLLVWAGTRAEISRLLKLVMLEETELVLGLGTKATLRPVTGSLLSGKPMGRCLLVCTPLCLC